MMLFDPVSAPRSKQKANGSAALPALIEGIIPLPSLLRLKRREYLGGLYSGQNLSIREIAQLTHVSQSVVLDALGRFGIVVEHRSTFCV
jgi:hypothetical protein